MYLAHFAVDVIGVHQARGDLVVVVFVVAFFDGERLVDDVYFADGAVVHEYFDDFAEHLSLLVPDDGVLIHRHAGVARVAHEGVAHGLHIGSEGADVVVAMDEAVGGVGVDVESEEFDGVAVHVEGVVALRIVFDECAVGGVSIARVFIVLHIFAEQLVSVFAVDIHHVSETCRIARGLVVEKAVAGDGLRAFFNG